MSHRNYMLGFIVIGVLSFGAKPNFADDAPATTPREPRQAIEKGLEFLVVDSVKWKKEHNCATCHHGTMTTFALTEAKSLGFPFAEGALEENATWSKDRWMAKIDSPRDTRAGHSMVNTPAIYLALMALANPKQESLSPDDLKRIEGHLLRHQEENGSWAWSSAPAKNRPPPFFESDEVATQLTYIALGRDIPAEGDERTAIVESRKKAADWLATITPEETTQSSALNLLINVQAGQPPETIQPLIEKFIGKQNEDGGWGQLDDRASDAYATGQALYALNLAGVKPDRQEIQRAVEFLVKTQNEDGSWPMTRRGHPGVTPGPFVVPLTYFGSVWGTMGLMRTVGTAG